MAAVLKLVDEVVGATGEPAIGEANSEMLRGLLWAAALRPDRRLVSRLGRLVEASFRKVRSHGARSPRLGNGAFIALGLVSDHMPGHDAIAELTRLEGKMRYETAKRTISKELERSAREAGLSRADLEELAIPHYELDAEGRLTLSVGDGEALLEVDGDDVVLRWRRAGRTTKTAPKALREARPERVKEVRELAKQMRQTLAGQAGRIERHYLDDRSLPAPLWRERYVHHPLVRTLSRRLFWTLEGDDEARTFRWHDGALRDLHGREIGELDAAQQVRLWHPVRASVEEVRRARRLLSEARVTQPFKQAYREVYLLTDAERETGTYSNRFAAHILRQHQFQALCQQRGWRYDLQGAFDSFNVPCRSLPAFDLVVEFWVEPVAEDEHTSEMGIYQYLSSDQVVFLRGERLPLEDVPELAFSEAMRDVDLFTSVASVGNDPNWHDRGEGFDDYWQSFAFGDLNATAETRREVLAGLLPLLKIADRCTLEDRWLVVRGDRRTYRIHLRSGHVMMDPNQQYLCIVADRGAPRKTSRVYLPFEGDTVLSLILSKAFLLAEDQKIADPTILSQISAR